MSYPNFSTLTGTVTYNDGVTPLDGHALLMIAYPVGYTSASIADQRVPQRIGGKIKVRIQNGRYDQSARIYKNDSLEPPSTQYVAYYYDNNNHQLGRTPLFTITQSPYTISVPSFPTPGGGGGTLSLATLTNDQLAVLTDEQLLLLTD